MCVLYWSIFMPPFKDQPEGTDLELWSSNVESDRKNVECIFGILKKRFLFLKHPIRLHKRDVIEMVIIYMLLDTQSSTAVWRKKWLGGCISSSTDINSGTFLGTIFLERSFYVLATVIFFCNLCNFLKGNWWAFHGIHVM